MAIRPDSPDPAPTRQHGGRDSLAGGQGPAAGPSAGQPAPAKRGRNLWIWVSAALVAVCAGLLVWAVASRSDLDSTQEQLDRTQKELAGTKQELDSTTQDVENLQSSQEAQDGTAGRRTLLAGGAIAAVKALYDDLAEQLGATQEDLAATEQDLEAANQRAAQAENDAAAAKDKAAHAGNETDKAKAEAEQARAQVEAAQSKATVVKDCAKAYISALGTLFDGNSVRDRAPAVRQEFARITVDCQKALSGS